MSETSISEIERLKYELKNKLPVVLPKAESPDLQMIAFEKYRQNLQNLIEAVSPKSSK